MATPRESVWSDLCPLPLANDSNPLSATGALVLAHGEPGCVFRSGTGLRIGGNSYRTDWISVSNTRFRAGSLDSGIVTDSLGQPIAGVLVRGGPDSAVTDRNGHYEFRSPYPSVPAWLRPPDGYERKPIDPTASFPLVPGQNMTVRRIAGVTISPPATVTEGAGRTSVNARVWFDTGQTEVPYADAFVMTSSDTTILRTGSGGGLGAPYIEGLKPGTASVTGRYFGVPSSTFQVQVQPR